MPYAASSMPTPDRPEPDRPAGLPKPSGEPTGERPRRVSVPEAALLLGISEDAVRSRLRRRTLRKEKAPDGGVFVLLGDKPTTDRDRQTTDGPTDERPSARETPSPEPVEELRSRIAYLERQLDREREARREEGRELRRLLFLRNTATRLRDRLSGPFTNLLNIFIIFNASQAGRGPYFSPHP